MPKSSIVLALLLLAAPLAHARYKVDVHAHASVTSTNYTSSATPAADLDSMLSTQGVDITILMPTPGALSTSTGETAAQLYTELGGYSRFKFMAGGDTLNYYIHGMGRGAALDSSSSYYNDRWTEFVSSFSVFPNGCLGTCSSASVATGLSDGSAIEGSDPTDTDPASYHKRFLAAATAIATSTSPSYLGFGEIGAYHISQRSGHPYIRFPSSHSWMQELLDIAATYGKVVDLHLELDAESVSQLNVLLAHNRSAKVVLEHVGWSTTHYPDASVIEGLLAANSNLYIALKKCHSDANGADCYTTTPGGATVDSDWLDLLTDPTYETRFMIGSDVKYWNDTNTVLTELQNETTSTSLQKLIDAVKAYDAAQAPPTEFAGRIQGLNAKALFGL